MPKDIPRRLEPRHCLQNRVWAGVIISEKTPADLPAAGAWTLAAEVSHNPISPNSYRFTTAQVAAMWFP